MVSTRLLLFSIVGLAWGLTPSPSLAQSIQPSAAPFPASTPSAPVQQTLVQPAPATPVPDVPIVPIVPEVPIVPGSNPPLNPPALASSGLEPEAGNPAILPTTYTLGVGDQIFVGVMNVPEYSAQYQVQIDGTINLPVLGSVSVWGMTVQQVAQELTQYYTASEILYNPFISVSLLSASPLRIVVAGEVNRPGAYNLGVVDGKLPTLTQAIQQAGGMTQQADLRQVQIIRPQRSGADETLTINLWEMLRNGDARQDLMLRDGDSIVLATAEAMNPAEAQLLGDSNLSPEFIQVGILGEARQLGTVQVPPNTPLNHALLAAGGLNNRARNSVMLIRLNPNGTVTQRRIHVDFAAAINEENNPVLQDRDVIIVRRSALAVIGDTINTVLGSAGQVFSLFGVFDTLFPASPAQSDP